MEVSAPFAVALPGVPALAPSPEPSVAAGPDAFAAIFAAVVGDVLPATVGTEETPGVAATGLPQIVTIPIRTSPASPRIALATPEPSSVSTKAPGPLLPPECPVPIDREGVVASDGEPSGAPSKPVPEMPHASEATPVEPSATTPDKALFKLRRRPPAVGLEAVSPDPPPGSEAETPEKEAPTSVPNAPVIPLDRTSETTPTDVPENGSAIPPITGRANLWGTRTPADAPTSRARTVPRNALAETPGIGGDTNPALEPPPVPFPALDAAPDLGLDVPVARVFTESTPAEVTFPPRGVQPPSPHPANRIAGQTDAPVPTTMPGEAAPKEPAAADAPIFSTASVGSATPADTLARAPSPNEGVSPILIESEPTAAKGATKEGGSAGLLVGDATATVAEAAASPDHGDDSDAPPQESPVPTPHSPTLRSAATEKPEAGADRAPLDRHLVVRQVAERIESLVAARPKDGVTIHLEPRDLGTITLVVKGLASALDVQVAASDERVQRGLDASRPELAQALAPRGIELRELRVAHAPTPLGGSSMTGDNPQGRPHPEDRPRPQTPASFVSVPPKAQPSSRAVRISGRGVDLLV